MKYQLTPKQAQFNNEGFVIVEGRALIYNTDAQTGEFINATYEYVAKGIGLPDHVCLDAPKSVKDGKAIIRDGDKWSYPSDHRGKKIYSTVTGVELTITEIGDIPSDYTLLKPSSKFDNWDGEQWVLDTEKQHQHDVNTATSQKKQLLSDVSARIQYLQDAVDSQIATEQETQLLAEWKKYRVLVNRIDVQQAPNIDWPKQPK